MYPRLLTLPRNQSLFLFGARNTGKSTLVEAQFTPDHAIVVDLLDTQEAFRFGADPNELYQIVTALPESITHIIIDEIQKVPKLLDVVQRLMKMKKWQFVMTGSSARKLKKGGANLLAGRAFVYNLYPLSFKELGTDFSLDDALRWGTLPEVIACDTALEKQKFLQAYTQTYLKEEIWDEHIIRKLDPFRRFLEVAAQSNGKVMNFSNIARDVGVDDKTIKSYYHILEDTLVGYFLEPYHNSFRKRLIQSPKFYFFDTGVVRSLCGLASVPLTPQTSGYGDAFEHYILNECLRLNSYNNLEYRFSYLRTVNDTEIDLLVERPGKPLLCIEIKSASHITQETISRFSKLTQDIPGSEAICLCNEKYPKQIEQVRVLPWQQGLMAYFV